MSHVNLDNARENQQREAMERIESRDECPFCFENLQKEHKEPILKEGDFWIVTKNQWPYDEAKSHFLIISRKHIELISEIPQDAGKELMEMLRWVEDKFNLNTGGVCFRFGDINYNGATVGHLHIHVLQPENPNSENYEPIRFRIGGK